MAQPGAIVLCFLLGGGGDLIICDVTILWGRGHAPR